MVVHAPKTSFLSLSATSMPSVDRKVQSCMPDCPHSANTCSALAGRPTANSRAYMTRKDTAQSDALSHSPIWPIPKPILQMVGMNTCRGQSLKILQSLKRDLDLLSVYQARLPYQGCEQDDACLHYCRNHGSGTFPQLSVPGPCCRIVSREAVLRFYVIDELHLTSVRAVTMQLSGMWSENLTEFMIKNAARECCIRTTTHIHEAHCPCICFQQEVS
jgi:hypothetical protein